MQGYTALTPDRCIFIYKKMAPKIAPNKQICTQNKHQRHQVNKFEKS